MENVDFSPRVSSETRPQCSPAAVEPQTMDPLCTAALQQQPEPYRALQASLPAGWSFTCFPILLGNLWFANPTEGPTWSSAAFGAPRAGLQWAAGGEGGICSRGQWRRVECVLIWCLWLKQMSKCARINCVRQADGLKIWSWINLY